MGSKKLDDKGAPEMSNDLTEAVRQIAGLDVSKKKPKQTVTIRCDEDLYKEAKEAFGSQMGKVFEAALRQALKERKKL